MTNPADLGIAEAGRALRAGELTSVGLTQACLDRIAERNPKIGAFVHLAAEQALASARQADALLAKGEDLGPLHGIPFAVKDVFDVEGWPVRFGCAHDRDRVARKNAEMVDLCLKAGAIALGIVATYELATVGPDRTSLYPQPRNPWNADHVTGGSSSGSAAAVASGMVRFALGSDTGGSARSPAAYCGIVGFKPSAGRFGKGGLMPLAPSMDHVGLLAATAADAATLFAALAGPSGNAATASPRSIGFGRNWCHGDAPAILALMDDAAAALSLVGHQIILEDLPDYPQIEDDGATILLAEQITAQWTRLKDAAPHVGKMAYASLQLGLDISEADLRAARHRAEEFTAAIDAILSRHAAVILPTTMTTAPRFSEFDSGEPVWTAMRTLPFNLTGHPALSVPIGMHDGLPLAMQIIGAKGADAQVLAIGAAFEAATDHGVLPPYLS